MEALVYIANGLYLSSYLVQDMLRLRWLTLLATACLLVYFYLRPEPLLTVVFWNLFFIILNAIQIVRLVALRKRRTTRARNLAVRGKSDQHECRNAPRDRESDDRPTGRTVVVKRPARQATARAARQATPCPGQGTS